MTEEHQSIFEDIYCDSSKEKIEKYGDPNKNLIITVVLILFISIFVVFIEKKEIGGITEDYSSYYPQATSAYIDIEFNNENIQKINSLTTLDIKNLPDFLSKILNTNTHYKTSKKKAVEKLMKQVLGDELSFGTWNSNGTDYSLIIFPIKREGNIHSLFKVLFGKNQKLVSKTYKGIRIITTKDKKAAYLINRERLFVANSYDALVFTLNNHILHNRPGLYDRNDVKKAFSYLDKDRIGTVLLTNSRSNNQLLNGINKNGFLSFVRTLPTTAVSILVDKDLFYLKSYTPYGYSKIMKNNVEKTFQFAFEDTDQDFKPIFSPDNIISYFNAVDLKSYINFYLELSNIKAYPEFEQFKHFVKMATTLDFEDDILESVSKNSFFATIDSGNSRPGHVAVLTLTPKTALVISKLVKLLQIQVPTAQVSKISYKNHELNTISSPKLPATLYYGNTGNLFVFGDSFAVESVIDAINRKQVYSYSEFFKKHSIYNSGLTAFIDMQKSKKFNVNQRNFSEKSYFDKIKNNVTAVFITAGYEDDIFVSSIQFSLQNNSKYKYLKEITK